MLSYVSKYLQPRNVLLGGSDKEPGPWASVEGEEHAPRPPGHVHPAHVRPAVSGGPAAGPGLRGVAGHTARAEGPGLAAGRTSQRARASLAVATRRRHSAPAGGQVRSRPRVGG